jgi:uncharacterized membrane protein
MLLASSATGTASATALVLAVFAASAVEMVEALTLVLAAGSARSWRSALEGTATAVVLLAIITAAVGAPLVHYVPIDTLRVVVGALLLLTGLSWLRKAILRSAGYVALHDEDAIFARTVAELGTRRPGSSARDGVAFAVAFKGVMLEGFEVVLIVISLGTSDHRLGLAALAAGAAVVIVGIAGVAVSRQLSEVPENALKTVVGVMLTSFGTFWVAEGAGVKWPGADLSLPVLIVFFVAFTALSVQILRRGAARPAPVPSGLGSQ